MSDRRIPVSGGAGALLDCLDALPSPSPVAMRLLAALDDATAISTSEVVELVSSGPCSRRPRHRDLREAPAIPILPNRQHRTSCGAPRFRGRPSDRTRSGFESMSGFTDEMPEDAFDIGLFWRHSLSVAVLAERIAERGCRVPLRPRSSPVCCTTSVISDCAPSHRGCSVPPARWRRWSAPPSMRSRPDTSESMGVPPADASVITGDCPRRSSIDLARRSAAGGPPGSVLHRSSR